MSDNLYGESQNAADLVGRRMIVGMKNPGYGFFCIDRKQRRLFHLIVTPAQHLGDGIDLLVGQNDGVSQPFRFFAVRFIVPGEQIEILMGIPEHFFSVVIQRITVRKDHAPSIPIALRHFEVAPAA